MSRFPLGLHAVVDPVVMDKNYDGIALRSYAYDKTMKAPAGSSVLQAQIIGDDNMYFWWKARKQNGTYRAEKDRIAREVLAKLPMEFAVEAQKLLSISLEGSVG